MRTNRFADLAAQNNKENKEYLKKNDTPVKKTVEKIANNKEEENNQPNKEIVAQKETEIKINPKFIKKEKETRSIRKNFLITPANSKWLKDTAAAGGMSENELINLMIESERGL